MPYDVFISYASADIVFAQELNDRLINEGFKVWFDKVRLAPGFDWYNEIEQGCESSRVTLPVMTPRWKNSDWTKFETYAAESVIPILFEGSWIDVATPPLERFQAEIIDINKPGGPDWSRLYSDIRRVRDSQVLEKATHLTHIHYRANEYFTGREKELIHIHEELHAKPKTGLTTGRVRAITAMGGAGKTTLVRQYVEKFWKCYPQMFWIDCRLGLEHEFAHIHDFLFPERKDIGIKDSDKAASALNELNGNITRLLILDNADDLEDLIMDWIPKVGACHTLITSRFGAFGSAIKTIHIFVLEKEPSIEFLKRRTGRNIDGAEIIACEILADKLGFLPLALEQAAAYIEQQGEYFGFNDYLLLYEEAGKDLLNIKTSGANEYPDSVFMTWKSTIAKLSPLGRSILHLSSYLACVPIPVDQIITASDIICEHAEKFYGGNSSKLQMSNKTAWLRGELAQLKAYSMIQYNGQSFTLHPLIQVVEINTDSSEERNITVNQITLLLQKIAPQASWEGDCRKFWSLSNEKLWSQILLHISKIEQIRSDFEEITESDLFKYLTVNAFASQGKFDISLQRCTKLMESIKQKFDSQKVPYHQVLKSLAYLQKENRMYEEALQSFTELYQLRIKENGVEAPATIYVKHNIAIILNLLGKSDEAEKIIREVLTIQKRELGENHYDTIVSIHNLGWWLFCTEDRWNESEPLFRHAYEYWKENVGFGILDTRIAGENLALLLSKKGDFSQAEQVQKNILKGAEVILSHNHLDCFGLMHNLAFYVFNNGKPEEALNLIREVVEGYRHYLPPNHNKILIALQELGTILWSMKRYSEAESVFHEVLTGYEITQGPDGKDTILTVANLANLLNKMGRPAACSTLLQRIIKSTMEKEGVAPLKLRQAALDCYNLGEYVLAESLLTRLLSEGFEVPGTHCHQARICLLTDRLAKAQEHVDLAWQYRSEAPSYIICRILWFKIAFAILTGTPAEIYHDRIKNALQKEDAFMDWSMNIVLTHIKHQISDYQFSFLSALVGALSAKQNIEKLNEYSEWINAKPEKI